MFVDDVTTEHRDKDIPNKPGHIRTPKPSAYRPTLSRSPPTSLADINCPPHLGRVSTERAPPPEGFDTRQSLRKEGCACHAHAIRQLRVRAPMSQAGRNMAAAVAGRTGEARQAHLAAAAWPLLDGRAGSSRATLSSAVRSEEAAALAFYWLRASHVSASACWMVKEGNKSDIDVMAVVVANHVSSVDKLRRRPPAQLSSIRSARHGFWYGHEAGQRAGPFPRRRLSPFLCHAWFATMAGPAARRRPAIGLEGGPGRLFYVFLILGGPRGPCR
jgi:hypothetical protein